MSNVIARTNIVGPLCLTGVTMESAAAFVRWRLVLPHNATATAANILAHERVFRALVAADVISALCCVAVTLLLYETFKSACKHLSLITASFGFLSGAIVAFASLFQIAALVILRGAQYLNMVAVQPLTALALAFLNLRAHAYNVGLVFLGLYCLLIVYLYFKSNLHPRFAA
jgi:Domain of unknown function (DUF4386)